MPESALQSEASFSAFLRTLAGDIVPTWKWQIQAVTRRASGIDPDERIVAFAFTNASPMPDNQPNTEAYLFDTRATFTFSGAQVRPFELQLAPRGFRYNRDLWGLGFNCAVERLGQQSPEFSTTHTPIHRQMRYVTQATPAAPFAALAQAPIPVLRDIIDAMRSYLPTWDQARQRYVAANPAWETEYGAEYDKDQHVFEQEIERFRQGCELIRTDPDVRLAFQLTNEVFSRDPRKKEWRLFQIVFLVSQIPGIAALADPASPYASERDKVDIIYFPTGGGKTEAYLGTFVFHCFYDRLRGKAAGVTAWTRFPLRLLTLQQTQRVADVIGLAELVRAAHSDPRLSGSGIDGFAVGYFVGEGGSPNQISNPQLVQGYKQKSDAEVVWAKANDAKVRQRWQRVVTCPSCRTASVQVDFDATKIRIIHRCTRPGCAFPNGVIPVYVVDNEIYRYLPAIIVGTVDKLAGIGNQRKLSQVFGCVDGRCIVHGYYKGKCCQQDCTERQRLQAGRPRGLSGPTLFVQDELHLLKEGLGTFDSHYETFIQRLRREFGQSDSLKIIASSATIESFERQVEHLYGRTQADARVFPGFGPTLGESFYAHTEDHPQRLFAGIIPHNKTIFNAILELIEYYHRETQALQRLPSGAANPYGGTEVPGSPGWTDVLDSYVTSMTYFLGNRELNSVRTDLDAIRLR